MSKLSLDEVPQLIELSPPSPFNEHDLLGLDQLSVPPIIGAMNYEGIGQYNELPVSSRDSECLILYRVL